MLQNTVGCQHPCSSSNTRATVWAKGCRWWQYKDAFCWQRSHSAEVNLIQVDLIRFNYLRKKLRLSKRRALPEVMTVILRCRWVNCVRIFNLINLDDGLMSANAFILTALLKYYGSDPSCRPEIGKWTAESFSENMKGVTHICSQLFQLFQAGFEQRTHVCA